jgi:hypothetical protein
MALGVVQMGASGGVNQDWMARAAAMTLPSGLVIDNALQKHTELTTTWAAL